MFSTFQDNQAIIKEMLQMVNDKIESSNVTNSMLTFHHINVRPIFIVVASNTSSCNFFSQLIHQT